MAGFCVRKTMCASCIYRPSVAPEFLKKLEDEVRDLHGGFHSYRACHHHSDGYKCCRGFWERFKDAFQLGQIAQRLGVVVYSDEGEDLEIK